jgi:hypothetical protein
LEGRGGNLIEILYQNLRRRAQKPLFPAGIRTEYLLNMSTERYCYANPLAWAVVNMVMNLLTP